MEDFSIDQLSVITGKDIQLLEDMKDCDTTYYKHRVEIRDTISELNFMRRLYLAADKKLKRDDLSESERKHVTAQRKKFWWQMIQLLPSSYNQTRNVMMNYEILANIYKSRNNHKLDEWREFCSWIEMLPYSELIVGSPSLKCVEVGKAALDGIQKSIAKAVQDSKKKDLVEVTRCINCSYYISADDMKNDEMYKGYENLLGCDGICTSTDKWTYETDFCSSGKEKW